MKLIGEKSGPIRTYEANDLVRDMLPIIGRPETQRAFQEFLQGSWDGRVHFIKQQWLSIERLRFFNREGALVWIFTIKLDAKGWIERVLAVAQSPVA